ncbi:patatin-like phospholipase family protein [Fulvivirga sedimenti]|uniref:Patatin-like phospholipase family protein n=1 Tax=Fulvivirga sedimenti TaxID=2879465 RepID=A0A9X1HY36_9BACT|nr:patatin-like phospholipase family protein [Fulvivirga sedimenti]MCA6078569.1 patatin-like phospholipase family protein [Fulvivirga sedimenti]
MALTELRNKKIALVLSSGGARGVAHIGVIEGLLELGCEISSIAGSSMGAVVGAVYAAGKLPEFKEWITNLDRIDVFRLMDFTLSGQGFVRGEKVFNEMAAFMGERNIEDLPIPFAAVATDITNRREVVFKKGNLYQALRASAAIPSVVKPVWVNGNQHVDGGVMNPIPIQHIARFQDDLLVVSDVNADLPVSPAMRREATNENRRWASFLENWKISKDGESKDKETDKALSYFDLVARSVDLMQDRISDFIIQTMKPDLVIRISRYTCSTFEFHRSESLIKCGRQQLLSTLENDIPGTE